MRTLNTLGLRLLLLAGLIASHLGLAAQSAVADEPPWYERQSDWNGFEQFHFTVADRPAYLVVPVTPAAGQPWVWRARFPNYHAEMDVMLLRTGFHIAYVDVAGLFGGPQAMRVGDAFYQYMTQQRGLAPKPALEGVSRGGLLVYNWAVRHPDKVACIYCDTPVCDFKSWPGGLGAGVGSKSDWEKCLQQYDLTPAQAQQYRRNPVDQAAVLAQARIPILHIVSGNDRVVPPAENTDLLKARLEKSGWQMEVITVPEGTEQSQGHHFSHPQPQRVVDFIIRHASAAT